VGARHEILKRSVAETDLIFLICAGHEEACAKLEKFQKFTHPGIAPYCEGTGYHGPWNDSGWLMRIAESSKRNFVKPRPEICWFEACALQQPAEFWCLACLTSFEIIPSPDQLVDDTVEESGSGS